MPQVFFGSNRIAQSHDIWCLSQFTMDRCRWPLSACWTWGPRNQSLKSIDFTVNWWLWQPSFTGGWTCRVSQNPAGNMHWTDWLTCRFNMVLECRWQTLGTEALWVGYSFCDFGLLCQFGIFWSRPIGFSTFFSLKVSSEWMCVVQSEREPLALRPRVIDNNRQTIKWQLF